MFPSVLSKELLQNSEQGEHKSLFGPPKAQIPSNVTRIVRAPTPKDRSGHDQISFYQRGVGTGGDIKNSTLGAATGFGLSELVREAYRFW